MRKKLIIVALAVATLSIIVVLLTDATAPKARPCTEEDIFCDALVFRHKRTETDTNCIDLVFHYNDAEEFCDDYKFSGNVDTIMLETKKSAKSGEYKEMFAELEKSISACLDTADNEFGKNYCNVTPSMIKAQFGNDMVFEYHPNMRRLSFLKKD